LRAHQNGKGWGKKGWGEKGAMGGRWGGVGCEEQAGLKEVSPTVPLHGGGP